MQDVALYYFGLGEGPDKDVVLDQLQLAPTVLTRMGVQPCRQRCEKRRS